jgi:hypothetical protein
MGDPIDPDAIEHIQRAKDLAGLARRTRWTSVRIAEQWIPIFIAPAQRAPCGRRTLGRSDDLIQPEQVHQENSYKWNRKQHIFPPGLENRVPHEKLLVVNVFQISK